MLAKEIGRAVKVSSLTDFIRIHRLAGWQQAIEALPDSLDR